MVKVKVFRCGWTNFGMVEEMTRQINEFIKGKKIISTNSTTVGQYINQFVYYEEL